MEADFMFRRKIYDKLLEWKTESDGRTALLIEGARRVGKSTVVEEFAKNEYESYILIDFSRASKAVKELLKIYLIRIICFSNCNCSIRSICMREDH